MQKTVEQSGCSCGHCNAKIELTHSHEHEHDHEHDHGDGGHKKDVLRLALGVLFLLLAALLPVERIVGESAAAYAKFALYLIPYFIIGGDVLLGAARNILRGKVFDENFLMGVATIGAFCLGEYLEAVAVMLFYQVGELFQSIAVSRSRRSISELMDIRPDYANVLRNGKAVRLDPEKVEVGETIVIKPGERVPLDGVIIEGNSQLDTAALTGESLPRDFTVGDEIISGSVNLTGLLHVRVEKSYGESTVFRILELVENAVDKKAKTESFITRFARYYTPIVCGLALMLAVLPPLLFAQDWSEWVRRGLIFLVVSCPCALVISVPMSFFGGIGGASRQGVLVKGSSYLEALAKTDVVVFDKTGTLTTGSFSVAKVCPEGMTGEELVELAAYAESGSSHPIAQSVISHYAKPLDPARVGAITEIAGHGVTAEINGKQVSVGNSRAMEACGAATHECEDPGTRVHVAVDGKYAGHLHISDTIRPDAKAALSDLHALGISKTAMLTGDSEAVAKAVAQELGIREYHAGLLPQDKVTVLERLLAAKKPNASLAFVGDGINDAPVLARADIGIAMGALGSDAAIEAADIVLMDDSPAKIAVAVRIARKTMGIVRQNIWLALGIKFGVLLLAALGIANMWLAVFADVGVAVLAILNAMRSLRYKK